MTTYLTDSVITIGALLPDLMSTYGDDGNTLVLSKRLRDRGYRTKIKRICLNDPVPTCDIYTLGGGEDVAQIIAATYLRAQQPLLTALTSGTPLLAICAGMQLLGEWFQVSDGSYVTGVGALDVCTLPQRKRAISELVSEPLVPGLTAPLTGFENHLGATLLGDDARPLGRVRYGTGNGVPAKPEDMLPENVDSARSNAPTTELPPKPRYGLISEDYTRTSTHRAAVSGVDGVVQNGIFATYMHGPCLARNPELADFLIAKILGVELGSLAPLDIPVVEQVRKERLRAAKKHPTRQDHH